jgi:hypothetical protein
VLLWWPSDRLAGQAERAVVVTQIAGQILWEVNRPRLLKLFAKPGSSLDVDRISDRCPTSPNPDVIGDDASLRANPHPIEFETIMRTTANLAA